MIAKPFDPMTLAASIRTHLPPAEDVLAHSRRAFLRRVSNDADSLLQYWAALGDQKALSCVLARIKDVAPGLAGAGSVFGFPRLSAAAADLEEAVVVELEGTSTPRAIQHALEQLLMSISEIIPDHIEQGCRQLHTSRGRDVLQRSPASET